MSRRNLTKFEDLSNEILFDIFEYLQGEELFTTFGGLNYRINSILNDNRVLMHITFARIKTIQSLYDLNQIQFLYIKLSPNSHPSVAADLQNSSVMPCAHRLSLDGIYLPDLRIGLSYINLRMPNLVHIAIKTYHTSPPTKNTVTCIIETLLELSLIRTFSLQLTSNVNESIDISLLNGKQLPFLEHVSIVGCTLLLHSIINLIKSSPNLYSLQMIIQANGINQDFSVLQQLTKATLKLVGFNNGDLKRFFSSMTRLVCLRLNDGLLIPTARLYVPITARLYQAPFGYLDNR